MFKHKTKIIYCVIMVISLISISGCKKQIEPSNVETNIPNSVDYKELYENIISDFWQQKRDIRNPNTFVDKNHDASFAGNIEEYSIKKDVVFLDYDKDGIDEMILYDEYDDILYAENRGDIFYPDEIKFIDIYKLINGQAQKVKSFVFNELDGTNTSNPNLYDGILLLNKNSNQVLFAVENIFKASQCYGISILQYNLNEFDFSETASEMMAYEEPAYINGKEVTYEEFDRYKNELDEKYSKIYLPRNGVTKNQIIKELYNSKNYSNYVNHEPNDDIVNKIESVDASSFYVEKVNGKLIEHLPEMILDYEDETAWVENVEGYGVGEWIQINLLEPMILHEIDLKNGYHKSESLYLKNSRIKKIKLEFSDGTDEMVDLTDNFGETQKIELLKPHETKFVKMTIVDIYEGTKYRDTCLTSVRIY